MEHTCLKWCKKEAKCKRCKIGKIVAFCFILGICVVMGFVAAFLV